MTLSASTNDFAGDRRPGSEREPAPSAEVDRIVERTREYRRAWAKENPDKVAEQRRRYAENHRDQIRARARDYGRRRTEERRRERARDAKAAEQAAREREYRRSYREANRDRIREQGLILQRAWMARQLAVDPDGFRAKRNANTRASWDRHREEYNFRAREKAREHPGARAEYAAAYREAHREELREKARAAYAANPRKTLDYNRAWKAREKRRIAAGLPTRRLHRTPTAERRANEAAADMFFSRTATPELAAAWRAERPTHPEMLAAFQRQMGRIRAADGRPIPPPRMLRRDERDEQHRIAVAARAHERRMAEDAENARLDSIARAVNAQRRPPDPRRAPQPDAAAPHVIPGSPTAAGGLHR